MKASEASLLTLLNKASQFVVPIYQRTYSWTDKQCKQLWTDILQAGNSEHIPLHFTGSVVYIQDHLANTTRTAPLVIIDGQQRLTTVTLIIIALANAMKATGGEEWEVEEVTARKLRNLYLLNPEEKGERNRKLLLTQNDRGTLLALIDGSELPEDCSHKVVDNYAYFEKCVESLKGDFGQVIRGLFKLMVVDIALDRSTDNPQLIFESMNSTGRALSQADLIRNYVLMGLDPELQTRLYEQYWRRMELSFGQEAYEADFDGFMRHYLTVKTGKIPLINDVYETFKTHSLTPKVHAAGTEALLSELREYSKFYTAMAHGKETNPKLAEAFKDLRELRVDVVYPLLLELYADYQAEVLSIEEFVSIIRIVESYVFRRSVCGIPTNSLNKTFMTFGQALDKTRYVDSVQAHFLLMRSYRRFPSDEEFRREIQQRDLYNFRTRSYWLRKLENHGHKEFVALADYTIEHIMPQNENLSPAWKTSLGEEWESVHQTYLHTLGNLTLTGYNSEYSDRPFAEKRDMEGGFRHSPLVLNQGIGAIAGWNKDEIAKRAARLSDIALSVWGSPDLDDETLKAFQPETDTTGFGLKDHPYLCVEPLLSVYELLRKEILALDPSVTESIWKSYIAYKAESNFVDLEPLSKTIKLWLNIPFDQLDDPDGLTRDISTLGHLGIGDVELRLESVDEVPYAMGLIRQALELQLGDG